jgi:hypothetical protein
MTSTALVDGLRPFLRWRYPILVLIAVLFSLLHVRHTGGDWQYFVHGSELLFGQHRIPIATRPAGLHLYANYPELQIGPLALILFMPFRLLGSASRAVGVVVLTAMGIALVWYLERFAKSMHAASVQAARFVEFTTLIGGGAVVAGWYAVATKFMHLDDVLVVAFGCLALSATRRGDPRALGIIIGLGVAVKPTALIMLPLVLQLPRRDWWKPVVIACTFAAVFWLPFVVADAGTWSALEPQLYTAPDSVLHLFGIGDFPEWVRPAQVLGSFVVGTLAVWRGRWPAVLMVGIAARLALDPGTFEYYTSALILAAFAWDVLRSARALPIWTLATFWFMVVLEAGSLSPTARGVTRLLMTATLIASIVTPCWSVRPVSAKVAA